MRFSPAELVLFSLFFPLLLFSCTSVSTLSPEKNASPLPPASTPTATLLSSPSSEKSPVAGQILLRNILSNEVTSLSVIASGKPVVVDVSATWCAPCAELPNRLTSVRNRLRETNPVVFLMVLQKGDSPDRLPISPGYPVYLLEQAPASLNITPPPLFPTVLILDAKGNVRSFLAGLYPTLVYYRAISEVFTDE